MSRIVPSPPLALPGPNLITLPAGTTLHRVHAAQFDGTAFNPCLGRPTRFAPIADRTGGCVASLYAGSTLRAAIFETIFHDIPAKAPLRTVPKHEVTSRRHSILRTEAVLTLVELRAPDLAKWGLEHQELISAPADQYERTAPWAEAIHHQFAGVEGLVWTSNRCDPDSAYLFFGDRIGAEAFTVLSVREGGSEGFLADVREAGLRAGIAITI